MDRKIYIAYGSNLNLPQMAVRCPGAVVIGKSELKDYELVFRGGRRGAVATVEPKKGSSVPVLVWEISRRDEKGLDYYEGYPRLYGKQTMDVKLGGRTVPAMAYIMTPGHAFGVPSADYASVIRQGYESAGFDMEVLNNAIDNAFKLAQEQEQQRGGASRQLLSGMGGWGWPK